MEGNLVAFRGGCGVEAGRASGGDGQAGASLGALWKSRRSKEKRGSGQLLAGETEENSGKMCQWWWGTGRKLSVESRLAFRKLFYFHYFFLFLSLFFSFCFCVFFRQGFSV